MPNQSFDKPSARGRVLVAIEDAKDAKDATTSITSAAIAEVLGLHPSTVRSHLRKLVANGQVIEESSEVHGRGRPRKTYRLAPPGPMHSLFTALVAALGDDDAEREYRAAIAGRLWAGMVSTDPLVSTFHGLADPVDTAAAVLTQLGFEIQSMSSVFGIHELRVCSCPLRAIAAEHPEVARGIQRGAVQQALDVASPELAGQYLVSSHPDPRFGDCEVTIRLSPVPARQES